MEFHFPILPGFREDWLCRQRRHERKFERRSLLNIELLSAKISSLSMLSELILWTRGVSLEEGHF